MSRGSKRERSLPTNAPAEQVRITAIAAGGEGVGRLADGRAVFVHRTAPGDLVEARVVEERPRWARARLLRVLDPSAERRPPPCPHYAECGGCTIEHLPYTTQLATKRRIVEDALRRIGGIAADVGPVTASPSEFRYRNRASFALRRTGSGEVHAGFHTLHEPGRIVPVDGRCLLLEEALGEVWDGIRAAWGPGASRLPPHRGLRLTVRVTAYGDASLLVQGGEGVGEPREMLRRVPRLRGIWHQPRGGPLSLLAGDGTIREEWAGETFELEGAAFLQVNRGAARLLEDYVREVAGSVAGARVIDGYCGVGVHGRALARAGADVTGIELDPHAVRAAEMDAPAGIHFVQRPVEQAIGELLPADLVILNPPRSGLDRKVVDALLATPPGRIIYISCNPATLARDMQRLAESYEGTRMRCFDLFPQTTHVETVVELTRTGGAGS